MIYWLFLYLFFLRIFIIYYCCYYVFCFYVCVSFLFFSMFFYLFSFLSFGRQLKKNLAGYPQEINLFNYVLIFFVMFNNFPFFLDCKYFCLFVTIWYYLFLFYCIMLLSLFFFFQAPLWSLLLRLPVLIEEWVVYLPLFTNHKTQP